MINCAALPLCSTLRRADEHADTAIAAFSVLSSSYGDDASWWTSDRPLHQLCARIRPANDTRRRRETQAKIECARISAGSARAGTSDWLRALPRAAPALILTAQSASCRVASRKKTETCCHFKPLVAVASACSGETDSERRESEQRACYPAPNASSVSGFESY